MPFTCIVCKNTFTRCAFIQHNVDSLCSRKIGPKTQYLDTKQPTKACVTDQPSSTTTKKTDDDFSKEVMGNDSLFMVVHLNNNEEPSTSNAFAVVSKEVSQGIDLEGNIVDLGGLHDIGVLDVHIVEGNEGSVQSEVEAVALTHLPNNHAENQLLNVYEIQAAHTIQPEAPKGLTKKGIPRKRIAPREKSEIKSKRQKNKDKHGIQPPCGERCKRKCTQKIPESRRLVIHEQFWSLSENERKLFVLGHVNKTSVKRRTTEGEEESKRSKTFVYNLSSCTEEKIIVCKRFFLSTLGYKEKNDMFVYNTLTKSVEGISPKQDQRGRHTAHNFVDRNFITAHILKYNPCVSHYRREHAPNRKYLPSEISIVEMHGNFLKEHGDTHNCSYDLYRSVISDMNISFAKLGHEECEKCTKYNMHNAEHVKSPDDSCLECQEWTQHHLRYKEARQFYEQAKTEENVEELQRSKTVIYSMDLQKVIMLPQMEQFKEVVFTKRIVLLNESFVPVGKKQKIQPIACLWHEGISGRKKEDITSSIKALLDHNRDAKRIIIWLDNCASQNKNWALFSYLAGAVNSSEVEADIIQLNFLEPGHTFMSADHFHHQVTQQIKSKGKLYDYADFEDAIKKTCSGKVIVKSLQPNDFFLPFDYSSSYKINKQNPRPYLSDMVQITFKRGSLNLFYKNSFNGEETDLSFLKPQYIKKGSVPLPKMRETPRGVNYFKKSEIIGKLLPLMPTNRHPFWHNLPTSDAPDLVTDIDE